MTQHKRNIIKNKIIYRTRRNKNRKRKDWLYEIAQLILVDTYGDVSGVLKTR